MSVTWTDPAFERIVALVAAETGMRDLSHRAGTEEAVRRVMRRAHVAEPGRFAAQLEGGLPLDDLIAELTVGESYFFRDPELFVFIRTTIVPDLLASRAAAPLRIWSAGCASGEEAYSLAVLLSEMGVDAHVLATDVSRAALQRARGGRYRPWALRALDPERVDRAFHRRGNEWELRERFRSRVTFALHNLVTGTAPAAAAAGVDLVLCRNVLMYLDADAVRQATAAIASVLADGGWLITGPSDPQPDDAANLHAVVTPAGVLYRKGAARGEPPLPVAAAAATLEVPSVATDGDRVAARARNRAEPHATPEPRASDDEAAAVRRLRALADREGAAAALRECEGLVGRWPLSGELQYLHAVLRLALHQLDDAAAAVRRVLYLDRSNAVAHLMLATILRRQERYDDARRAYAIAHALAVARPADERLPLADGDTAASIARTASAEIAWLDARGRPAS